MGPLAIVSASQQPIWAPEPSLPKNRFKLEPYEQIKEYGFRTILEKESRKVVVLHRNTLLSIDEFIKIISSSAIAFINATPFLTFTQPPRLYPLPNIAERIKLLTDLKTKVLQTCANYKTTWDFTYFTFAETRARYEQQWSVEESKIISALSFIESIPQQLKQLYHLEKTVRTILPELDTIVSQCNNGRFSENDKMNLERLSDTLYTEKTLLEDKNNSPLIVLIPQNRKSLLTAVGEVCEWSTSLRHGIPFLIKFSFNPFEAYRWDPSTITKFGDRLSNCLQNGLLDTESMDAIFVELLSVIEKHHVLFDSLSEIANKCPKRQRFAYLESNINSLRQFIYTLEDEFIFAEIVRHLHNANIPITHYRKGLLSLIDSTNNLSEDEAVGVNYYGLMLNTKRYLDRLTHEHPIAARLKATACKRVIDRTKLFITKDTLQDTLQHVDNRETAINNHIAKLPNKPTVLLISGKQILVHREALQRVAGENVEFFKNLFSQTWQDSPKIVIPENCVWPAVVEFVSWMYGLSALSTIPDALKPRFSEICDYFFMCDKDLTNKFNPL